MEWQQTIFPHLCQQVYSETRNKYTEQYNTINIASSTTKSVRCTSVVSKTANYITNRAVEINDELID